MAKKVFSILVLAVFFAGTLAAQEREQEAAPAGLFSAGVGGLIGGDFGGGAEGKADEGSMKFTTPYFGGGGYAFFDAKYAEFSLAFYGGGGKSKMTMEGGGTSQTSENDSSITNFNIGLLGKYPFAINDKLTLFPLLGIDYSICLSAKTDGEEHKNKDGNDAPGDFSALWFKFGGGGDFSLTEKVYLRLEALYGIRLANKAEADMEDFIKAKAQGVDIDTKTLLGHGLTVKLGVGYKF